MKKLFGVILLVTVLSISLVGCQSPTNLNTGLTEKEILESVEKYCKTDIISQELVCDTSEVKDTRVLAVLSAYEDTTQYPSYMLDSEGNYVSMEQLGKLVKTKYFQLGNQEYDKYYKEEGVTYLQFVDNDFVDYDQNQIFAKLVLILEELSDYKYYILNNEVLVRFFWHSTDGYTKSVQLKTASENLLSDTLVISPDSFFTGYLEMKYKLDSVLIDEEIITLIYDDYVTNGTFNGYVLNME